jgi:hypothetical protein
MSTSCFIRSAVRLHMRYCPRLLPPLFFALTVCLTAQVTPDREHHVLRTDQVFRQTGRPHLRLDANWPPKGQLTAMALADSALYADSVFLQAANYPSGGQTANFVAVADVNGDGKPDLVAANGDGSVGILLGNGDGTFRPATSFSSGGYNAYSVAVADVNSDGKLDLIVGICANSNCNSGAVSILIGNGDGTFEVPVSYSSGGPRANSVAAADLNADGRLDVIVANGNTLGVLLGNGDGTLQPAVNYSTGGYGPDSIKVADVNSDGKLDVVVANQCSQSYEYCDGGGNVGVLLGKGDGSFQSPITYDTGASYSEAADIALADINGDAKPDILIANVCTGDYAYKVFCGWGSPWGGITDQTVTVLLGNGDGTFRWSGGYSFGGDLTNSVAVADVSGDGKPDLLVANQCIYTNVFCPGGVSILLGNGDGTFQAPIIYGSGGGANSVAVADLNVDGRIDVVEANGTTSTIGVLLNGGNGTFHAEEGFFSGGYDTLASIVTDLNGDGKLDLVLANECIDANCNNGSVGVLLGNGDGTFQPAASYSSGGYDAYSVAVADINGDGKPDVVVANCSEGNCTTGSIGVLLGNGDGTLKAAASYSIAGLPQWLVVADVNGDHRPDVVTVNSDSTLAILLGNGDGTFQSPAIYHLGGLLRSVAAVDLNADGKLDLVVAGCMNNCSGGLVDVLLGNGDGTFQPAVSYSSGGYDAYSVAVGDINGDGNPDVVVANCADSSCTNDSVAVLLANGDGTLQSPLITVTPRNVSAQGIALADFNGDGNLDIATAAGLLLLGNGDGTFQTSLNLGTLGPSIVTGDFNADARPDLATGGVVVLMNIVPGFHYATTTTVTASSNPAPAGQALTLVAKVVEQHAGIPTGTVVFFDSSTVIGSSSLNNGVASLTTSTLSVGTHAIRARYGGDPNFAPSTSAALKQLVQGAIVTFSQRSLNFGNETLGIPSATQSLAISNTGNIALDLSIEIAGTNSADYAQVNNCGTSISTGGTCTVAVTFTPTAAGVRAATVRITDNAPNSPQALGLSGIGIAPVVAPSPTSLSFGSQLVGTTSQPKLITLSTNGTLKIGSIATSAQFLQTNDCGTGLPAGGKCSINLTFKPAATGVQNGILTISDSGQGSPQTVALSGSGIAPSVSITATNLVFGQQLIQTTSASKSVKLSNTGTAPLSITSIKTSGDFSQSNTCGFSVPVAGNCTINVMFKPTATGNRTGTVTITDNASGGPQKVILNGTGVAVSLSTRSLSFTDQVVGTSSAAKAVTLTNHGSTALSILGITISADFLKSTTCGSTVAAGASCTISVRFKPTTVGTRTGALTVKDSDPSSPEVVSLAGVGTFVGLSPLSLSFPAQVVGTISTSKPITVTNHGSPALTISAISTTGDFAQNHTCGSSLAAGASCTISVFFTPTATGTRTGALSVSDSGGGSPQKITMSGTGTEVTVSPTSLAFGNQSVGTTSAEKIVTVTNHGSTSLSIAGVAATGDFHEINACGTGLSAGASCQIEVTFSPTVKGARAGTLSVSDNGGGSPQKVSLAGTGT